jgi:hypothetical protein
MVHAPHSVSTLEYSILSAQSTAEKKIRILTVRYVGYSKCKEPKGAYGERKKQSEVQICYNETQVFQLRRLNSTRLFKRVQFTKAATQLTRTQTIPPH